jgi:hypothetical protein
LPVALDDELMRGARVRRLVRIAWHALRAPEADGGTSFAGKARFFFTSFLLGEGFAYVAAQCRIVSVGLADALRYPLPRRWHFLYLLLRLPSWLWRYGKAARRASTFAEASVLDVTRIALGARSASLGRATVQPGDDAAFQGHTQGAAAAFDQAVLDETLDPFEGRGRIAARPAHNSSQCVQIAALNRGTKSHCKRPVC